MINRLEGLEGREFNEIQDALVSLKNNPHQVARGQAIFVVVFKDYDNVACDSLGGIISNLTLNQGSVFLEQIMKKLKEFNEDFVNLVNQEADRRRRK